MHLISDISKERQKNTLTCQSLKFTSPIATVFSLKYTHKYMHVQYIILKLDCV